jgi:NAD-dependent deacetylase
MSFADLNFLPPTCYICKGILKPDMVFFNEPIPTFAKTRSFEEAKKADVMIIIGTNAEVLPAANIPVVAKEHGAKIIEVNIEETHFTHEITDIFLKGKASEMMKCIGELLYL